MNPYFASKTAKHDATLTSLLVDLSEPRSFPFTTRCHIVAKEGPESLVAISGSVREIFEKNERGARDANDIIGAQLVRFVMRMELKSSYFHSHKNLRRSP